MPKPYTHIIWDWNGTLLDDALWGMAQMNKMLSARKMPTLGAIEDYHRAFAFPIIEYYRNVGFDFTVEPFEQLAEEFVALYHGAGSDALALHDSAIAALGGAKAAGIAQVILSASRLDNLREQLIPFGIERFFNAILGISDIYATSKVQIGLDYIAANGVRSGVMVGDSVHDYEVANALGVDCILAAIGHQSREALEACGVPVCASLQEVMGYIL